MQAEQPKTTFVMSSGVYDFLKKLAQIWLPALGTLYFALAAIWGLPAADKVTGTVIAIDTFLGVLLNVSKGQYEKSGGDIDGHISVEPNDKGTAVRLNIDPMDLVGKDKIVLKVGSQLPPVV